MQLGMIGLGKMGLNMTRRLLRGGHEVVAFDLSGDAIREAEKEGGKGAASIAALVPMLTAPRTVWLMVPAGKPVDDALDTLLGLLQPGDTVIEGGNSYYKDSIARRDRLAEKDIHFVDAGVSGGIWGLDNGYCLMVGGEKDVCARVEPIFTTLAPPNGYLYCGSAGSGHFVKMVHNGIEYGMMAAYGEGFELMKASRYGSTLDFEKIAHLWNQGSVVRSWLLELLENVFKDGNDLSDIKPYVEDSGEGRWTVQQAVETAVPAPVITAALFQRFASREGGAYSNQVLAALRNEFGGHRVAKK
ncbi:MAG: decarboxylating 6-phosphogluconate dehydrogenase [Nitrospirota bacterium]|nr:decarboxylating 6-phosphogluconate dehydrogenase [Nitrospirota bacterium]